MLELDHLFDQQRFARLLGVALTDNQPWGVFVAFLDKVSLGRVHRQVRQGRPGGEFSSLEKLIGALIQAFAGFPEGAFGGGYFVVERSVTGVEEMGVGGGR
jgi:hypothetical protein